VILIVHVTTMVIFIVSVFIVTGNFIPKYDIFAQVISDDLEESNSILNYLIY
jgi:hypothetical protein